MMYNFCINDFEGPLDLLLHLIKEAKVDIYEINTWEIIDQYLAYINQIEDQNIDLASEYLVMAAELIHLKSRMLINQKDEVELAEEFTITSEEDLKQRLLEYQRYKEITKNFKELEEKRSEVFTKFPERIKDYFNEPIVNPGNVSLDDLINAFLLFQARQKFSKPLNTTITHKEISLEKRIKEIRTIIRQRGKINFFDLFTKTSKEYLIVTFLSILEMSKNNEIYLSQLDNYSPIMIEKRGRK